MAKYPNTIRSLSGDRKAKQQTNPDFTGLFRSTKKSLAVWLTFWLASSSVCSAQFFEDFESNTTSWERREGDCIVLDANWTQKRQTDAENGNRFEQIGFSAGPGSKLLVSHPVPPSFVISELNPTVKIKSSRPGIRLMVRVVLPETPSPSGTGPMTALLVGPTYQSVGQWQTLSFAADKKDLAIKLRDEIWLLRRQHGNKISGNNAYIDQVVLNLYTGAGNSSVQIDELKLDGIVDAQSVATQASIRTPVHHDSNVQNVGNIEVLQNSAATPATDKQPSLVVRDGTVLLVEKRPFLPKIIQHRGETFEFLKALGFNVIELNTTATYEQLEAARNLDLWLVCPAPSNVGLVPIDFQFDRVLAWTLGDNLGAKTLQFSQQKVREIRESDQREGRPIVAQASTNWIKYAQFVDILNIGLEPLGTSFLASQYNEWIKQRSQTVAHNSPVWVDIQTDFPPALVNQIRSIASVVPPTPIEPQQMRYLVYEAITGGARGLRFKSRSRLDGTDPTTRLRAMTIEWINAEIHRLEPWIAAGVLREPIATNQPGLDVNVINTNRSRLLLIQRTTHHEQYLAGDVPSETVRFNDPDTTFSERATMISEAGLQPLTIARTYGGNELQIENCPHVSAVVLSEDPAVTNRLHQSYSRVGQASAFQLHVDLTRQWLAIMQLIEQQTENLGQSSAVANQSLEQSLTAFQNFNRMMDANSQPNAIPYLLETDQRLALVRRELITVPLGMFQSKSSSPLLTHISLIPLHWELASRLNERQWNPNGLAAGDFENLNHLARAGWENRRLDDERVSTKVELTESARVEGQYGLRMETTALNGSTNIDATPLWISSHKIPVRTGQLVRIHGWVNIPEVIRGNVDGLMITDSLGGDAMAERIPITSGWQEFTLYRSVPHEGDLQLTFALTGFGVALLDEVTVRTVDLPSFGQASR